MLAALSAFGSQAAQPVNLGIVFTKGETLNYKVRSSMTAETRGGPLRTFMPQDLDINYDFSIEVQELKADGIAVVRYKRPKMDIVEGETADSPPKTKTEKTNFDLLLTVSPINEILDMKDLTPAKKKVLANAPRPDMQLGSIIGQFVNEMYRLALFTGSFDSALDFAPKLSNPLVKPGDTWKKTVGYQPQKLKGREGKNVVQRLDYQYEYKGPVTINGKPFQRVEATLDLNTDLSDFINDTFDINSDDTGIKKLPLHMKSKIEFNLDPVSRHCVIANATTEGGYEIYDTEHDLPVIEERLKGRTLMQLALRTVERILK